MKVIQRKRVSLAGFLASGFTILSGLILSLVVILVFSDAPGRDTALVAVVFGLILLVPIEALRKPKDPAEKKVKRWYWPSWRRKKRKVPTRMHWMRMPGQTHHRPFGTPELPDPVRPASTFAVARRRPVEP